MYLNEPYSCHTRKYIDLVITVNYSSLSLQIYHQTLFMRVVYYGKKLYNVS